MLCAKHLSGFCKAHLIDFCLRCACTRTVCKQPNAGVIAYVALTGIVCLYTDATAVEHVTSCLASHTACTMQQQLGAKVCILISCMSKAYRCFANCRNGANMSRWLKSNICLVGCPLPGHELHLLTAHAGVSFGALLQDVLPCAGDDVACELVAGTHVLQRCRIHDALNLNCCIARSALSSVLRVWFAQATRLHYVRTWPLSYLHESLCTSDVQSCSFGIGELFCTDCSISLHAVYSAVRVQNSVVYQARARKLLTILSVNGNTSMNTVWPLCDRQFH